MDRYLFEGFTVEKWLTIIFIIWGATIVWAIVTSLRKRIKSKDRKPSSLCALGCIVFGFWRCLYVQSGHEYA
jgi:hypothetical protein